jgi:ribosomal protein S12 methylthiotransferase accessory factor
MTAPLAREAEGFAASAASDGAIKCYRRGTHRTCSPQETLARMKPLLPALGITRVANVTGLDRTGIPVVTVCRPNARSVSVSQGKGLTLDAAKASGIMEAAEVWHAEHILNPLKLACAAEMRAVHRVIDIEGLPRTSGSRYTDALPLLWIEGYDLFERAPVWVPFEIVSANYTLPLPPGSGCFQSNTKGLASGNHALEAICHGLAEVVERDARTIWQAGAGVSGGRRMLDLASVNDPDCVAILGRFEASGLRVRVWSVTSDVGIAAFVCTLMGDGADGADPEFGAGCHPSRTVALLRALTEAGQSRNTYISASRDDYFPQLYSAEQRRSRETFFRCLFAVADAQCAFEDVPDLESVSLEDDLAWMLDRLRDAGMREAVVVDLTREGLGVPVMRVVVPGLAGILEDAEDDPVLERRMRRPSAA